VKKDCLHLEIPKVITKKGAYQNFLIPCVPQLGFKKAAGEIMKRNTKLVRLT